MVIVLIVLAVIKCFVYTHVTLRASCKFHDSMFKKVRSEPTNKNQMFPSNSWHWWFCRNLTDFCQPNEFLWHNASRTHPEPLLQRSGGSGHCAPSQHGPIFAILSSRYLHHHHHRLRLSPDVGGRGHHGSLVCARSFVSLRPQRSKHGSNQFSGGQQGNQGIQKIFVFKCWLWFSLQRVSKKYTSDEEDGQHQSLSLHLAHHFDSAGPQHHPRLQHSRKSHQTVRYFRFIQCRRWCLTDNVPETGLRPKQGFAWLKWNI